SDCNRAPLSARPLPPLPGRPDRPRRVPPELRAPLGGKIMISRIVLFAVGALSLVAGACPPPSNAARIDVTTRRDVVADDGLCSLREAVGAANSQQPSGSSPGECVAGESLPVVDVIRLPRGRYRLDFGFPGDD